MSDSEDKRSERCPCGHCTSIQDLVELLPKQIEATYAFAGAVAELARAVGDMIALGAEEDPVPATYLDGSEVEP